MEIFLTFKEAVEAGAGAKELRFAIKIGKIKYRKIACVRGKYLSLSSLVYFFNIPSPVPINFKEEAKFNYDIFRDRLEKHNYNQSKLAKELNLTRQAISLIAKEFQSSD